MMARVGEVAWVLDHLDDLDSDFSVFHRRDDFRTLPAPRMFALAARLPAYGGALAARLRRLTPEPTPDADEVDSSPETLATHPSFAGLIEMG